NLIYKDQAFIPGEKGEYPEYLENYRTTDSGLSLFFRPVKITDEPLLKEFFYDLSDKTIYRRFFINLLSISHEKLQKFSVVDFNREMVILAVDIENNRESALGIGQYIVDILSNYAEIAFIVRDDHQKMGIGTELLTYLTYLAKRQGLAGFTAEVLPVNKPMLSLFAKEGFEIEKKSLGGVIKLKRDFTKD
ncbi:MAG: GNAT family N-acetyltransferase, partial [Deltaproteobacteria bacterium]|nr:GNAT family N-acetyltransferase [Candidatus Zymogenaceae bacterium]